MFTNRYAKSYLGFNGAIFSHLIIRLNPNIKYKTRGNAALAIDIELNDKKDAKQVKELVIEKVEKMAVFSDENTNP